MNIDRKFQFFAVNPVNGNSYSHEDALILCAKDAATPAAISAYQQECIALGCADEHIESVGLLYERVREFQLNGGKKVPDTNDAELSRTMADEDPPARGNASPGSTVTLAETTIDVSAVPELDLMVLLAGVRQSFIRQIGLTPTEEFLAIEWFYKAARDRYDKAAAAGLTDGKLTQTT